MLTVLSGCYSSGYYDTHDHSDKKEEKENEYNEVYIQIICTMYTYTWVHTNLTLSFANFVHFFDPK